VHVRRNEITLKRASEAATLRSNQKEKTMKALLSLLCAVGLGAAFAAPAMAQGHPRGTANLMLGSSKVTVEYGRTSLNGRSVNDLLSQLPAGEVWRLGADKSTTFTTTSDLDFSGTTVPKGEYSLWARKESDNSWKLVFNSQHGQWGTDHNAAKDVVAVPLKQDKASSAAEQVTIELEKEGNGGEVAVKWGDLELSANFTAK
jgi:hypothetical protein